MPMKYPMASRRIVTPAAATNSPEAVARTRYPHTALGAGTSTADTPENLAKYSHRPMRTAKMMRGGRKFFMNGEAGFRVVVRSAAAGWATEMDMVELSTGELIPGAGR